MTSSIAGRLVAAEQVYNCLWSHSRGDPVHIHYVVQPVTAELMERHGCHGPALQVAMFAGSELPGAAEVEAVADRARAAFRASHADS